VEDFFSEVKGEVEAKLEEIIRGQPECEKIRYALSGGKRLRPCLAMLVFYACGGGSRERALEAAAAIELVHSASLVHDDILDHDLQRRGNPATYLKFGVEEAVLLGHKMVSLAFKTVADHDVEVIKTFNDVWSLALEGEIMDVELSKKMVDRINSNGRKLYFDVVSKKTASLFAGSCKVGAQEAEAGEDLQNLFWEYGNLVGTIHQLADDYLEIINGRIETLPLIFLISSKGKVVKMGRGEKPKKTFEKLGVNAELLFKSEIERVTSKAESMANDERVPNSIYKRLLVETPKYVVSRMLT
jgi:geranylgeranyl pyrophosphate synthase